MTGPMKRAGFAQGIMAISSTKKEEIGTLRITQDGRKFRYAKAGSSALSAGLMSMANQPNAQQINVSVAAAAIGDKDVTLTITYAEAIAENALAGGYLQINQGTGEGIQYQIESNPAFASGDTTLNVALKDPIKVALEASASSEASLIPSPWYGTEETETEENIPVGIPPVAVTGDYYYWSQTGGIAIALVHGTPGVGTMLTTSSMPPGGLRAMLATVDVDQPLVAKMYVTAGISGEYKPVQLLID